MRILPFLTAAGVACLLFATVAWAADLVVIRSNAPGIARGSLIPAGTELEIPAGKSVTLISPSGTPETLKGPFKGKVGARVTGASEDGERLVRALAKLVDDDKDGATLGAMRAVGDKGGVPTDLWVINVTMSGTYCVVGDQPTRLWRPKSDKKGALSLKLVPLSKRVKVSWPAGEATIPWPDGIQLRDRGNYLVQLKGSLNAIKFQIRMLPEKLASAAHRVVWMARKGCDRQAGLLMDRLR